MNQHYSLSIAGNPNAGKTTLFNALTGSKQRTGNWAGVTVDKKSGIYTYQNQEMEVIDLPGTYSLEANSEDEQIARNHILGDHADLVINVVDAGHIERNLLLTYSLMELQRPMIVLLNMMEMAREKGLYIDPEALSGQLGIPVLALNPTNLGDMEKLKNQISHYLKHPPVPQAPGLDLPEALNQALADIKGLLRGSAEFLRLTPEVLGLKILEEDAVLTQEVLSRSELSQERLDRIHQSLKEKLNQSVDIIVASARHGIIKKWLQKGLKKQGQSQKGFTEKLDRIALSRFWGVLFFMAVMYLLFWVVTHVGGAFIDFFDILFGAVFVDGAALVLRRIGAPDWTITLVADGLGAGIQTVATFIPIIFSMFFMLSLLESSGYMARAAFVMDRFMGFVGLPGKAFVPMLVGFGCTVPAVMGSRTLDNDRDRYLTVFMAPFMSCGARLPVYALFGAAFFPHRSGLMVFSLYLTGIVLAVLTGLLLKNTLFRGNTSHFVMELPPYHLPRLSALMDRSWERLKHFVKGAGKVVILAVLILAFLNSLGTDGSFGNEDSEQSVLTDVAKAIVPLFEPMGLEEDNWPAMVGLFTGLFAKEAVVGTLSSLYSQIDASTAATESRNNWSFKESLLSALRSVPTGLRSVFSGFKDPLGTGVMEGDEKVIAENIGADDHTFSALRRYFGYDNVRAYSYLLFILLYCPCVAALGAILKEIGPRMGWLAVSYLTALAWSLSTLFFQILRGHSLFWIAIALSLIGSFILLFILSSMRGKKAGTPNEG